MAQAKKAQVKIKTTDRGGMARLIVGCVLIAVGLGWFFGLFMDTSSAWYTLRFFRDTANGLGGVLCGALPFYALWGGGVLYASSRRKVSYRIYLCALGMYLCLLSILTLTTYVGNRTNPLMLYIGNSNKTSLGIVNNTSFTAYLQGAYNLRAFNGGQLAGGGLLGMLLAYPLYAIFGAPGGVTLLALLMLVQLLILIRINPADIISAVSDRRYQRREEQEQYVQPEPAAGEETQPVWQPGTVSYPMEPLIRPQTVNYTGTSVQSDVEQSYLVNERDLTPPAPAEPEVPTGFVPVESGVLYEEHIPVMDTSPERPARRRRSELQPAVTEKPVEKPVPQPAPAPQVKPQPASARQPEIKQEPEELPWYSDGEVIPPIVEEKAEPAAPVKPAPVKPAPVKPEPVKPAPVQPAPVQPPRPAVTGEAKQVFTDPAVPLTGERISITGQNNDRPRIDPFEVKHTAEPMKKPEGEYVFPPMGLLREPKNQRQDTTQEDNARARMLEHTLSSFNISATVEYVVHGPAITRFALRLADGVNVNRLNTVSNNLAMSMKAVGLRIEIPIPGTSLVGIEVPNEKVSMVTLKEVLDSDVMRVNPSPTAVAIGKDITGQPILCELSDMPHMLIAGATGSGKSVCINSIIQSILYRATPQQVRMLMIDPKLVELQPYPGIPHLLTEVVSDPQKAAAALDWLVQEMGDRYRRFQQIGVRNIQGYNKKMTN
ncbi:MAG: hypothetical protein IJ664_05285, partial [Clostridia bacterium]|nr:hypothetical protein [Clostridia bacterium]